MHNFGIQASPNVGRIIENIVAVKLKVDASIREEPEIYYWKDELNRKEVDFLIRSRQVPQYLIQVCWNLSDRNTRQREISVLLLAMKELNLKKGIITSLFLIIHIVKRLKYFINIYLYGIFFLNRFAPGYCKFFSYFPFS